MAQKRIALRDSVVEMVLSTQLGPSAWLGWNEHCWALVLCGALDAQLRAIITLSLPQLPRASKHICFHTVINYEL